MPASSKIDVRHHGILLSALLSFVDMLANACAGTTLTSCALSSVAFFFTVVMIVCSLERARGTYYAWMYVSACIISFFRGAEMSRYFSEQDYVVVPGTPAGEGFVASILHPTLCFSSYLFMAVWFSMDSHKYVRPSHTFHDPSVSIQGLEPAPKNPIAPPGDEELYEDEQKEDV